MALSGHARKVGQSEGRTPRGINRPFAYREQTSPGENTLRRQRANAQRTTVTSTYARIFYRTFVRYTVGYYRANSLKICTMIRRLILSNRKVIGQLSAGAYTGQQRCSRSEAGEIFHRNLVLRLKVFSLLSCDSNLSTMVHTHESPLRAAPASSNSPVLISSLSMLREWRNAGRRFLRSREKTIRRISSWMPARMGIAISRGGVSEGRFFRLTLRPLQLKHNGS